MKSKAVVMVAMFLAFLILMIPVCFASELALTYDANGNLITGDGNYREYNSLNQLEKIYNGSSATLLLEDFTYHPVEERILVKNKYYTNGNGSVEESVYYVSSTFVRVVNSSGTFDTTYVSHEGAQVAQVSDETLFIHADHLGSSTVVTNTSGDIIENTSYTPYGEIISGGEVLRFDYEGKEYDSLVEDYDFHFRKYKPEWALFTQPDSLIPNVYDPQSLNRYMFERGNPYGRMDPSGHFSFLLALGVIAYAMYGGYKLGGELTELEEQQGGLSGDDFVYSLFKVFTLSGAINIGEKLNTAQSLSFGGLSDRVTKGYFRQKADQAHVKNALNHVQTNPSLGNNDKDRLSQRIINTGNSGNSVRWYFNPNTGRYQYWSGDGRPSNKDFEEITYNNRDSSSSSSRGGSSSGPGSSSSGTIVEIGGKYYNCRNCK